MENNIKQTSSNNKKLLVLVGILVVVAIIIIVAASQGAKKVNVTQGPSSPANVNTTAQNEGSTTTAPAKGQVLPAGTRSDAPGAALITQDNKIVNMEGVEVKNNLVPGSPEAPKETGPISKDQVAKSAISMTVASTGFKPAEFRVKANQPVTLVITGGDPKWAHVFAFRDPILSSIAVGIGGLETRAITFKAPAKGEYEYFCDIPGHPSRGEVGKMIVE